MPLFVNRSDHSRRDAEMYKSQQADKVNHYYYHQYHHIEGLQILF